MKKLFSIQIIAAVLTCCLWTAGSPAAFAVKPEPGYYRFPLDMPALLSANFGEVRANHLHSGIDIKTGGTVGHPVLAAADGYIARVVLNPSGFGRALYVAHPNGTTTVYGHLDRFTPAVERYLRDELYRRERWKADLFPGAGRFPVRRGEVIAYSGNSGFSMGPHLHFEVRETASQRTVNPLALRLFPVKDDLPPRIVKLYWFGVDTLRGVPVHSEPRPVALRECGPGRYRTVDTAVLEVGSRGYFAVETTDRKNGTANTMGAYRVTLRLDGRTLFDLSKDGFLFSNTRYVNSVSVYPLQRGARNEFYRLALQTNNFLPSYRTVHNRGLIALPDTLPHAAEIEIEDDNGNRSRLSFRIRRGGSGVLSVFPADSAARIVDCRRPFTGDRDGMRVSIPARALYESVFCRQESAEIPASVRRPVYSPAFTFLSPDIPLHRSATVVLRADGLPASLRAGACLARITPKGALSYAGGSWKEGWVTASVREAGTYCVVADTVPPRIAPAFREGADLRRATEVSFVISDDFSGVADFRATVDGRWELFEYDVRSRRITHRFDLSRPATGARHRVTLEVTDGKGNKARYEGIFLR